MLIFKLSEELQRVLVCLRNCKLKGACRLSLVVLWFGGGNRRDGEGKRRGGRKERAQVQSQHGKDRTDVDAGGEPASDASCCLLSIVTPLSRHFLGPHLKHRHPQHYRPSPGRYWAAPRGVWTARTCTLAGRPGLARLPAGAGGASRGLMLPSTRGAPSFRRPWTHLETSDGHPASPRGWGDQA